MWLTSGMNTKTNTRSKMFLFSQRYPVMWQGLLALKNDSAAVQMHFVGGSMRVAHDTLPRHTDGSTPPLRIAQRMRLEPVQLDQVHRKMKVRLVFFVYLFPHTLRIISTP